MSSTRSSTAIIRSQIRRLTGKQVKEVTRDGDKRLTMTFSDGTTLVVGVNAGKLAAEVNHEAVQVRDAKEAPTKRQLDYLLFIAKYLGRFGRAPAESDIERHFLVSAPSVNQMMQMLERRGFISREPGVPRSARICIDLAPYVANRILAVAAHDHICILMDGHHE
jgi:DNA-binding MarR family transcriptional regulator